MEGTVVRVLGTAQDGGLPQIGCFCPHCEASWSDASRKRLCCSLLISLGGVDGSSYLIDCTPDIKEQSLHFAPKKEGRGSKICDGIFLTHAHMGHYVGLLQLGKEAYAVKEQPVYLTQRFASFLSGNEPFRSLSLEMHVLEPGCAVQLKGQVQIEPVSIPHRSELSDVVGFIIAGPRKKLLYIPDADHWNWDVESLIVRVDFALLDGCFFSADEIPGRTIENIPHPLISDSIVKFSESLDVVQRDKIYFTHLNHSNPCTHDDSAVRAASMHVLQEGQIFSL